MTKLILFRELLNLKKQKWNEGLIKKFGLTQNYKQTYVESVQLGNTSDLRLSF